MEAFVSEFSAKLPDGALTLDAGAGGSPYVRFFSRQRYVTTDVPMSFNHGCVDVFCDIADLPFRSNLFDVVVCTQVLEHVPDPAKVIDSFHRVLRPGGKLFLTAPQGWGIHNEPFHFFNFTVYGLERLFLKSGFNIETIRARGGSLAYLAYRLHTIPRKVLGQYRQGARLWDRRRRDPGMTAWKYKLVRLLAQPAFFLLDLIASGFLWADRLDCEQRFTLGYSCVVSKP